MFNKWMFSLPVNELVEAAVRLVSWGEHVSTSLWKEAPWSSEAYDCSVLEIVAEWNTYRIKYLHQYQVPKKR